MQVNTSILSIEYSSRFQYFLSIEIMSKSIDALTILVHLYLRTVSCTMILRTHVAQLSSGLAHENETRAEKEKG